ncbi:MAG: hypothetical protein QM697_02835 [Lachnospiraceae bacterium]
MQERLRKFMYGRYGTDRFSQFLMVVALLAMLLSLFTGADVCYWIAAAIIGYAYFRVFSRNHERRYQENQKYLRQTYRFRSYFGRKKLEWVQRKTHHIYRCPNCRQKIRIPKGKGKIVVMCPKCRTEFTRRS